jgi:hypothetical protein
MNLQEDDVGARLAKLESAINGFRHKLELHGLFSADHKVTETELRERLEALRKRAATSKDHQETHSQASALEAALNRWISGTDLEFKP